MGQNKFEHFYNAYSDTVQTLLNKIDNQLIKIDILKNNPRLHNNDLTFLIQTENNYLKTKLQLNSIQNNLDALQKKKFFTKKKWADFIKQLGLIVSPENLPKDSVFLSLIEESLSDSNFIKVNVRYETGKYVMSDSAKTAMKIWLYTLLNSKLNQLHSDSLLLKYSIKPSDFIYIIDCEGFADRQVYQNNDSLNTLHLTYNRAEAISQFVYLLFEQRFGKESVLYFSTNPANSINILDSILNLPITVISEKYILITTINGRGRELPYGVAERAVDNDYRRRIATSRCTMKLPTYKLNEVE
jgi:hypothetical protein